MLPDCGFPFRFAEFRENPEIQLRAPPVVESRQVPLERTVLSSDEELFLNGGDAAMTQLVGRFEYPLFRFLLHATGDAHAAEDLFQETFLRLHRARGSYNPGQPLKPYLYRIALSALADARTRNGRAMKSVSLDGPPPGSGSVGRASVPAMRDSLAAPASEPHDDCQREETRMHVRAALQALPDMEREVVLLRIFEGLTFAEIAQITNAPVATAKSRMLYALRRLRPVLEAYLSGKPSGLAKDAVS
jgi:RNA polymerase sigma-70 factor (ECF subfamily)